MFDGIDTTAHYEERAVQELFLPLLRHLTDLQTQKGGRVLVLLAAPPGAGKTTLLSFLETLSKTHPGLCPVQVIGMDGFHRRQEYLLSHTVSRDGQDIPMVRIKGAPVTFDLESLTRRIQIAASGAVCTWPVYDRLLHNPVEDAVTVDGSIVLLEGNYLLIHGTGDDNVHFQNAVDMVTALENAGKQFEFRIYPNKNHSIYGGNTRLNLYQLMTDFIHRKL